MRADPPAVTMNPDARIQVLKIGTDAETVFVVDDAVTDLQSLIDFACTRTTFIEAGSSSLYPGLNAPLPASYVPAVLAVLGRPLAQLFGHTANMRTEARGFFGLANIAPSAMKIEQYLPHTDTANLSSFAAVHFLSGSRFGGTAFYRHRSTGFENISPSLVAKFSKTRRAEIDGHVGDHLAAMDLFYQELAYIDPVPNRFILYRATQLHSAKLAHAEDLTSDPGTSRLTANMFINI